MRKVLTSEIKKEVCNAAAFGAFNRAVRSLMSKSPSASSIQTFMQYSMNKFNTFEKRFWDLKVSKTKAGGFEASYQTKNGRVDVNNTQMAENIQRLKTRYL